MLLHVCTHIQYEHCFDLALQSLVKSTLRVREPNRKSWMSKNEDKYWTELYAHGLGILSNDTVNVKLKITCTSSVRYDRSQYFNITV